MSTPLEQAVAYIKAGEIEKGKQLLIEVLRQNPRDENAWLWMSRCVTTSEQKEYCFQKVLAINPQNQHAIEGLKRLNNPVSINPPTQPKANQQQSVKKKGLSTVGAIAVVGLVLFTFSLIGCFVVIVLFRNQPTTASNLPPYTVNDVSDNGKTNVAYFLVADKSLTQQEAERIIAHYKNEHIDRDGYLLINIWIFCDTTYANYSVLNDPTISDDEFYSHILYWYQTGEISSAGTIFQTKADGDYPTFSSACR